VTPRSAAARILAEHGVTAAAVAYRAGVTRQAVSWYLSGRSAGFPDWLYFAIVAELDARPKTGEHSLSMPSRRVADAVVAAAEQEWEQRKKN